MRLSLEPAYRSFGGEVEASSAPTICRLPDSRRHQHWGIARYNRVPEVFHSEDHRRANEWIVLRDEYRFMAFRNRFFTWRDLFRRTGPGGGDMRQIDSHRRSKSGFTVYRDMTVRLFHKAVNHAQTQSATLADVLCRVKRLKCARDDFRPHSFAVVEHGGQSVLARFYLRLKAPLVIS